MTSSAGATGKARRPAPGKRRDAASSTSLLDRIEASSQLALVCLAAITLLLLAPFAGRAFNIDEPLFVKAARQITIHPLDPYGFTVNWYYNEAPMSQVTENPPLACYYAAVAGSLFGFTEAALHLAFLLPALAAVTGTYLLARRFTRRPFLASLATIAAPAFLVSSTTVMCDTMMLALWIWTVLLWIEGIERNDLVRLTGAGVLIGLTALTKYYGVALVPLLACYALFARRRAGLWIACLALPVLMLLGYQAWTHSLYGKGLLSDAASYALPGGERAGRMRFGRGLIGLVFTGGCVLPALVYAPVIWRRRSFAAGALLAVVVAAAFALGWLPDVRGGILPPRMLAGGIQFGLYLAGGVSVLMLALAGWRNGRDPGVLLFGLWILGTFVFATFVNWTINARSILPLAPAVAILLARKLDQATPGPRRRPAPLLYGPLLLAVAVSWAVTWADMRLASAVRASAEAVEQKTQGQPGTVWFQGHWGFQHYMEAFGARPLEGSKSVLKAGDFVAVPLNNCYTWQFPDDRIASGEGIKSGGPAFLTTMHPKLGAAFYAANFGPLPFGIGAAPPEGCVLLRVKGPDGPVERPFSK